MLGEPASLSTLLELGNRTLDILHNLVHRPPGQSITDPGGLSRSYTTPLGVKQGVTIPAAIWKVFSSIASHSQQCGFRN